MSINLHKHITLFLFLLLIHFGYAQSNSNIRTKTIVVSNDTLVVDTFSIVPGSLISNNNSFRIDNINARLFFTKVNFDTLQLSYRVFPFKVNAPLMHKDSARMSVAPILVKNLNSKSTVKEDIFNTGGLNKGGSISRGISFGNNQDLAVNSNLNLQLSGKIYEDIEVLAAISDNTIPIQADGNTQQLQEFDKVYIQFKKNNTRLLTGDFQITESTDKFLRFNKKAQGLSFSTEYKMATLKNGFQPVHHSALNVALSKGKFSRYQINGVEGNQGPYKLRGAENESFIIVLSGTEKIYVDGKLLTRGQNNDYIIDYNNSEITFTSQQLITKDKRIIVEFQYSDKNYTRTLLHAKNDFTFNKLSVSLNLYSEQDVKEQQLQQQLNDEQIKILQDVGDSIHLALSPNIDTMEYSANYVLYEKKDTIVNSITYTIYQYSTDAAKAKYRLAFSDFAQGKGNYIFANSSVNGRTYKWIAPLNGVPQGRYEPQSLLITPKQRQMATLGAKYKLNSNTILEGEFAVSNKNNNIYSDKDKGDDSGIALQLHFENKQNKDSNSIAYKTIADYQLVHKNFSAIERFRSTEFERDWNIAGLTSINETEHYGTLKFEMSKSTTKSINFNSSVFTKGNYYKGLKLGSDVKYNNKIGTSLLANTSFLKSYGTNVNTQFIRYQGTLSQNAGLFVFGLKTEQDNNRIYDATTDTLIHSSFVFQENGVFITTAETLKNSFNVSFHRRTDYGAKSNSIAKSTVADNLQARTAFVQDKYVQLMLSSTYRALRIADSTLSSTKKPENTLLNRIDLNVNVLRSFINSKSYYEFGSGLEIKREYSYLQVASGQGTYAWIDYNSDGVQQLNEFEIAKFSDQAQYIKVYTPTNEFVKTYSTQFNEVLNLQFAQLFQSSSRTGMKKFISKFHNQLAYRTLMKTGKTTIQKAYVPYSRSISDTSLISTTGSLRNTLFFNRGNPMYSIDFTYSDNQNKNLLTSGVESRELNSKSINIRWNFSKKWSVLLNTEEQEKSKFSQFFSNTDFKIHSYIVSPKITLQPNSNLRISTLYNFKEKENDPQYGTEKTNVNQYGAEMTYNISSKGRLDVNFSYIKINYNKSSENSSPLEFEMLEGLQRGDNFTWTLALQSRLANNMQVSLNYNGRASNKNTPVHIGGVQVQMLF